MNFTKILISFTFILLGLSACHYMPFLKFKQGKDGEFPNFSKKWHFAGGENDYRRAYDVTHYDWRIFPNPNKKKLNGTMIISYRSMLAEDTLLIDLQSKMHIRNLESTYPIKKFAHKGDLLYIIFEKELNTGEDHKLIITYSGKPASILGLGPNFWDEDINGKPFMASLTQGIGPYFMMPCKDLLYDEADSATIRIETSKDLIGVANGTLVDLRPTENGHTFTYEVKNRINIYNISYNIGDYVTLKYPYLDISGNKREIEAVALREDSARAHEFYAQAPVVMRELEELFGLFPWWNDGCRFIESAVKGGAMEHQSAISMGKILQNNWTGDSIIPTNGTLIHELSHEWWGNSVTATDYGDVWLHEGMASYCEALVPERLYGQWAYDLEMKRTLSYINNERPVIKPFGVRYNSWAYRPDGNIYNKGAAFMHTLRMQLNNDSLFFETYKAAYHKFQKSEINSDQLDVFFSEATDRDWSPYFQAYLRQSEPPTVQYYLDTENSLFNYRFKTGIPEGFEMRVLIGTTENATELYPTLTYQSVKIDTTDRNVPLEKFGYIKLEKDVVLSKKNK